MTTDAILRPAHYDQHTSACVAAMCNAEQLLSGAFEDQCVLRPLAHAAAPSVATASATSVGLRTISTDDQNGSPTTV